MHLKLLGFLPLECISNLIKHCFLDYLIKGYFSMSLASFFHYKYCIAFLLETGH